MSLHAGRTPGCWPARRAPILSEASSRRLALQHYRPERPPGRFPELRLDQRQQPADDVGVVLPVPDPAQLAGRVAELVQPVEEVGVAAGPRPVLPGPDELLHPVNGDGPQPGPEGSPAAPLEPPCGTTDQKAAGSPHDAHEKQDELEDENEHDAQLEELAPGH